MTIKTRVIDAADPAWNEILADLHHDTYHLSEYVALEAQRTDSQPRATVLTDESGEKVFLLPYLVRDCKAVDDTMDSAAVRDVVSPYGYPGYVCSEAVREDRGFMTAALQQLILNWRAEGVCSAFLRLHPILNESTEELAAIDCTTTTSPTVAVDLSPTEDELWSNTVRKHRAAIRKSERLELTARVVDYQEYLPVFQDIYAETMKRTSASEGYFFSREYFSDLATLGDRVSLIVVEYKQEIIAAMIMLSCDGILQAHLGGSRTEHLPLSPFGLLLHEARRWAKWTGQRLFHLGGGLGGANDRLFAYKAGFSPGRGNFTAVRIVVDPSAYEDLLVRRARASAISADSLRESNFFPAYRCGLAQ